ncbi:hypothetical protein [Rubellimicrobium arenae]|uniref:hypothetical protein n=1 Tax=Rubellimicrobium arenae TaxID=2817372 RepID=UPI001B30A069|nr:hypothetical protein [Rubellimicrobium arenae]
MKRLSFLLLPLLAACAAPGPDGTRPDGLAGLFQRPSAEPEAPPPLPPQVVAALPPGVPQSVVVRNGDGCYLLSVEVTDPPSGYPLRDAAGNPVCDGSPVPVVPVDAAAVGGVGTDGPGPDTAPPLVPGSITPPAPIAPLDPT